MENTPHIESVIIVGSYARGTNKEDFDLDIVIITSSKPEMIENQVLCGGYKVVLDKKGHFEDLDLKGKGNMKITEVKERNPVLIEKLLSVWESSVRATHLFLSDNEIRNIKEYVPQALSSVPVLAVAENENGNLMGFMGIAD